MFRDRKAGNKLRYNRLLHTMIYKLPTNLNGKRKIPTIMRTLLTPSEHRIWDGNEGRRGRRNVRREKAQNRHKKGVKHH